MEGLLYILYDRVDGRISRPDLARIFIVLGGYDGGGGGGVGVAKNKNKNRIEIYLIRFYYLYYLEFRISIVRDCEVGLTTDEELRKKLVLMHQVSLCEFQREFKFGMEEK